MSSSFLSRITFFTLTQLCNCVFDLLDLNLMSLILKTLYSSALLSIGHFQSPSGCVFESKREQIGMSCRASPTHTSVLDWIQRSCKHLRASDQFSLSTLFPRGLLVFIGGEDFLSGGLDGVRIEETVGICVRTPSDVLYD